MFIKLLSEQDRRHLLILSEFLAIADKPLLWDGKLQDEVTAETNMANVSIQVGEQESEILASMRADAASVETAGFAEPLSLSYGARQGEAEARLIEQLKALPFNKTEDPVARLECVLPIFRNLLKEGIT